MWIENKSVLIIRYLSYLSLYQITDIDISKTLHLPTDICQQPLETCGATFKCAGSSTSVLQFKSSEKNQILSMSSKTLYIATAVFGLRLFFLHYYYNAQCAHEANGDIERGAIHKTYTSINIYFNKIKILPRFFYWIVRDKLHVEKKE